MNYVDPIRSDKSVVDNDIIYTLGYYNAPASMTGVTDESHTEYDSATAYNVGDYCKIGALKAIYRSSDDSNTGNYPPAVTTKWTYWGPLNSYKMLAVDEFIGSQTEGTDITISMSFSGLTAFALLDLNFSTVLIEQKDSLGNVICSEVFDGQGRGVDSYYQYFYSPFDVITDIIKTDLAYYAQATLHITFTGPVKIGVLVTGVTEPLGCTLSGTSLKFEDSSSIKTSEVTGFRTVLRYGSVKVVTSDVLLETSLFDSLAKKVNSILGHNVLFIPVELDNFTELVTIGYFETFEMPVLEDSHFQSQATIIGVI